MTSNLRQELEVRLETDCHQRPTYTERKHLSEIPDSRPLKFTCAELIDHRLIDYLGFFH